jgi:SAM-dependent methyltransferase
MDEVEAMEPDQGGSGLAYGPTWGEIVPESPVQKVASRYRFVCPDCGIGNFKTIGQYVYYYNRIKLNECTGCGLVYSDRLIDPTVIKRHFERAYKEDAYFVGLRRRIFQQIAMWVDDCTPREGSVLDIGGAKGHLLAAIKAHRPDLRLCLNDLSSGACEFAERNFQFDTVCGGIDALEQCGRRFNTLVMSDVLYYEPDLKRLWSLLPRLLEPGGTVVIRVPNKLPLIRLHQYLRRTTRVQRRIRYFNPEHIYVLTPDYLVSRLRQIGLDHAQVLPSELLVRPRRELRELFFFRLSTVLATLSAGRLIATPSFLVVARSKI